MVIYWSGVWASHDTAKKFQDAKYVYREAESVQRRNTLILIDANLPADPAELQEILHIVNEEKLVPFEQPLLYRSYKEN